MIFFLLLALYYGWIIFAFLHYRLIRQDEFLHVVTMAAATQSSISRALGAYLEDRPRSLLRRCWDAFLMTFVFPGYYWWWHRRHSYDGRVEKVVRLLEEGVPLNHALRMVRGVAPRESIVAAAVGEKTGRLAACLTSLQRRRLVSIWILTLPRLLYPILLLLFLIGIAFFIMIFIIPKFEKIFADFHLRLPYVTENIIHAARWVERYQIIPFVFLFVALIGVFMFANKTFCWYFPLSGYFYRRRVQGRILSLLGTLLEADRTVPQALETLTDSGFFQGTVLKRLQRVRDQVNQGQALPDCLYRNRLLPRAWVALLESAQRTGRLPKVLTELGESQIRQVYRGIYRLTMVVFPLSVLLVGLVIGFFVVAMFEPLVTLINGMGQ